jgi:hypothetical protein
VKRVNKVETLEFSNQNIFGKSFAVRDYIFRAIDREKIASMRNDAKPQYEMLPSMYFGNSPSSQLHHVKLSKEEKKIFASKYSGKKIKIGVYGGATVSPSKESALVEIFRQLNEEADIFERVNHQQKDLDAESAKIFAANMTGLIVAHEDTLVNFSFLASGSHTPYAKPVEESETFNQLYDDCRKAPDFESKLLAIRKLSKFVSEKRIVAPVVEVSPIIRYNSMKIKKLGSQFTTAAFNLENVELR